MRQTTLGMTLAALCTAAACGEEEQSVKPRPSRPAQVPSSTSEYALESYVCMKPEALISTFEYPSEDGVMEYNSSQYNCNPLMKNSDHVYSVPCDTEFTACMTNPQWLSSLERKPWATDGPTYDNSGVEMWFTCSNPGPGNCFSGADSVDSSWARLQPGEVSVPYQVLSVDERLVPVMCPEQPSLPYRGFYTDGLTVWTDNTRTTPEARLDLFVDCYVPQ